MFEARFGLHSPPFQLSPDPDIWYESRGHGQAMSYLKFGVFQREGFIVVTGEIGAGKTTLVKSLLQKIDPGQVLAAEVTNTKLDSGELLRAIGQGFGVPMPGASKARMLGTLEAFFTAVAASGRRALLIVDEAQNLGPTEIEELRMLSNFQIGKRALLQSFLVGQPGLRRLLQQPQLEQLRQRVIAACHLGPLTREETRAYIDFRLRCAGWQGDSLFDDGAVSAVHARADGVPRRINLLCSRMLLTAALEDRAAIDGAFGARIADELQAEVGAPALA
jgi:putative secretion ATPase (PEP-CTERM system associated)